jgi:hypothetical protein
VFVTLPAGSGGEHRQSAGVRIPLGTTAELSNPRSTCYPLVEKSPTPLLIGWIRDQAEHYGKLVSNYRAVGIVPPISRKPASQ